MADFDHSTEWINLEKAAVLLLDPNSWSQQIARQMLFGFGVRAPDVCQSSSAAREVLGTREINLILCNDILDDMTSFEFVHWLRHSRLKPNDQTPVIIMSGHTKRGNVDAARDCGANFIVAKPVSAKIMLERVLWVAREGRPFVEAGKYLGPDRRFHESEPPQKAKRRRNDPIEEAPASDEPNGLEGLSATGSRQ
jgi:DNA-binding response OmpR family regulator